jgi:subtilisin family serine protease
MLPLRTSLALGIAILSASAAAAQLLPQLSSPLGATIGSTLDDVADAGSDIGRPLRSGLDRVDSALERLRQTRLDSLSALVRNHPDDLALDLRGDPAVRDELLMLDPDAAALDAAQKAGFALLADEHVEGIDIRTARLRVPAGLDLVRAERRLRQIAHGATVQSIPIFRPVGTSPPAGAAKRGVQSTGRAGPTIGLIDGGVASLPSFSGSVTSRGFAAGAPVANDHATAIASILLGHGRIPALVPGGSLLSADVYGRDPRGGNALAIARALGWLAGSGVRIITISLVGPDNPLLAKAIAAVDKRGILVVAAVGNDGAAAPPAYPASYPQVIAVTGVDAKGRPLIEAGRAKHIDFAAPAADLLGANAAGGVGLLRGTSYAAPFVAGTLANLDSRQRADRSGAVSALSRLATRPGNIRAGLIGRGVICGRCATR